MPKTYIVGRRKIIQWRKVTVPSLTNDRLQRTKQNNDEWKKVISGKVAHFYQLKATILLMVALMVIGVYSPTLIPREEEP